MRKLILAAVVVSALGASFAVEAEIAHISREAAINVLRDGGILSGKTRVVSAQWGSDTHEWLITLRHPDGGLSAWFVDASGQNYHGGPCKH
jgi:predicted deacylase